MSTTNLTYNFADTVKPNAQPGHRRSDGNGSLTYSASSGESTDSSFSGILGNLDLHEEQDFRSVLINNDGNLSKEHQELLDSYRMQRQRQRGTDSSLQYSTDHTDTDTTISPLSVMKPQTITGQPSDSHAYDGGGIGTRKEGVLFVPAKPSVHLDNVVKNSSPPPRATTRTLNNENQHQIWYRQPWMCGMTDAFEIFHR